MTDLLAPPPNPPRRRVHKLTGLIAATHTPFGPDGALNLLAIESLAAHLERNNLTGVFISGTTGESHSLTLTERKALTTRWAEVLRGSRLKLIVHVGHNCVADARELAAHAAQAGAYAIAALAPSYFKPATLNALVDCCVQIASAAPMLPFYFYDIPSWTGVGFPMSDFLVRGGERIPNLAGIKFTNMDLVQLQQCLRATDGAFDILFGNDECLLASLALGVVGAVGSTYNFAAPVYHRLLEAFQRGDLETARCEQYRAVQIVNVLVSRGFLASAKAVMKMLGLDVGPARLPVGSLTSQQFEALQLELEAIGFFDWLQPGA